MKLTKAAKHTDFQAKWFLVDAEKIVLGKLSTEIAKILRGKEKSCFSPHVDCGDHVVVINAEKVALTGAKLDQKMYRSHSGYLGNLKEAPAKDVLKKKPTRLIEDAVYGMLPKNKLRKRFMAKLHLYAGPDHKHAGQNPEPLNI
jgi:large subunit ribosomal protein L13